MEKVRDFHSTCPGRESKNFASISIFPPQVVNRNLYLRVVMFPTYSNYAEETFHVAQRTERSRYVNLRREICRPVADPSRKSESLCGRCGGKTRSQTNHRLSVGARTQCSIYRTLPGNCRNLQNQGAKYPPRGISELFLKKLFFLNNSLLTFYYSYGIITLSTVSESFTQKIFTPRLPVHC